MQRGMRARRVFPYGMTATSRMKIAPTKTIGHHYQ
jgi:hypothetical protein